MSLNKNKQTNKISHPVGCRFGWLWTEFSTWPPLLPPWCLTTSAGWITTSIEFEKWLDPPLPNPPRLMSPIFLLAIRRYQSYFSHIRKKAKNRGTTTHTWYNLDYCHARPNKKTTVEPRKINNKLSFVGVRCSSCKQIQKNPEEAGAGNVIKA